MIPRNWKLTYASYFGCQQRHIKYWYQLSDKQQQVTILKFIKRGDENYLFDMSKYVYRVSVAGLIIDRLLVAKDDL